MTLGSKSNPLKKKMAEDLIDYELDGDAPDDIEPIQGEPELYEHFRTVVGSCPHRQVFI